MNSFRFAFLALVVLAWPGPTHVNVGGQSKAIEAAVLEAMKVWHVPGAAVVIVRDDEVIYLAGHGVRKVGEMDRVTADTLFALGSCSKAFTTAAMAVLVDEKKLHWDDRVSKHIDWFHLSDPLADKDVRLRDLLCHRTGVGSNDALWYRAPWKPEETARRVAKLPLDKPFRTAVQYQSTMFTAAGLAAAAADRCTWRELIQKRLLDPLGMKDTRLNSADTLKMADYAIGHLLDRSGDPEIAPRFMMEDDAAGSIHSSARDMAKWLRFHLSEGMAGDTRLVSANALGETHTPQMVMRQPPLQRPLFPDTLQMSYGLAWVIHDYRGLLVIAHGGAIDGFRAQITLVPQKKLGIAVISNLHETSMNLALSFVLVDLLLDLPKRDWHAIHRATLARMGAAYAEKVRQREESRRLGTKPSQELIAYVGTYEHPAYGKAKIDLRDGKLRWEWRNDSAVMEHFQDDTFTVYSELTRLADVRFALDRAGKVERCTVTGKLNVEFRKVVP